MNNQARMENSQSDPECQILKVSKSRSCNNFIEWNVDMSVTVSRVRRSKIFQRIKNIFIFLLALLFIIIIYHFKREIRTLQEQVQCMNTRLKALMSDYDRLDTFVRIAQFTTPSWTTPRPIPNRRIIIRNDYRIDPPYGFTPSPDESDYERKIHVSHAAVQRWINSKNKTSKWSLQHRIIIEGRSVDVSLIGDALLEAMDIYSNKSKDVPPSGDAQMQGHWTNLKNKTSRVNQFLNVDTNTRNESEKKLVMDDDGAIRNKTRDSLSGLSEPEEGRADEDKNKRVVRIERAILAIGRWNGTDRSTSRPDRSISRTTEISRSPDRSVDKRTRDSEIQTYKIEKEEDVEGDDVNSWREMRSERMRRDEGRGKKRRKTKRPPKRSRRRLGPLVATFVGAVPEHVTDTVHIGPWVRSTSNDSQYAFNRFHLVEDKKSIEVTAAGLYLISVQIFYFGESTNFSYWILLTSEGSSATQNLVKCATVSAVSATEVSCHTSIVAPLKKGDRIHVQQQEKNRLINMRQGHSHVQLVLLSNIQHKRRVT